jgi:hypothetical protein
VASLMLDRLGKSSPRKRFSRKRSFTLTKIGFFGFGDLEGRQTATSAIFYTKRGKCATASRTESSGRRIFDLNLNVSEIGRPPGMG